MEKRYHIMTSCDDNLVPYVIVGLTAMAWNLKGAKIDFYLLHSQVSKKNIDLLQTLCQRLEGGSIRFHEAPVPDAEVYTELAKYGNGWPGEAYYSLCAHLLLPEDVDRALYLDAGDTLIIGDIESYYQCDFQGKSLVVTGTKYIESEGKAELYRMEDLGNWEERLPGILRGYFNSGSYMMNLDKMRKDGVTLKDYQDLAKGLQNIYGENNRKIYWGAQGLLSAAFIGDVQYYGFPQIRNVWYMPYNFGLWYYNIMFLEPDYSPAILHYTGMEFKPWDGTYPIFLSRFQKKERLRAMKDLKLAQVGYFYLWHEYAIMANKILDEMGV